MEVTLEKIELVKDRTGVSYKEAKQALEEADGSVVDAIINIEETIDSKVGSKNFGAKGTAIADSIKALIKKGNVSKIIVKKEDEVILNIPVNAGILGVVITPVGTIIGIIAAFGFKCTIEIVKTDGTIIDVSDAAKDTMGTVIEKGSVVADVAKEKGEIAYNAAKEKATEAINKAKEKHEEKKEDEDIDFSSCFDEEKEDR